MKNASCIHSRTTTQPSTGLIPLSGETGFQDSIGHAVFKDNPFQGFAGDYKVIPFTENATVSQVVDLVCSENRWLVNYIQVKIGDQVIPKESWGLVRLKKNAPICLYVVPQGSGGGGGILKMVGMIAVVAVVSYFTLGAGSAAFAGYFGGVGSLGAMVAGAMAVTATSLLASMALNALFPAPQASVPSLTTSSSGDIASQNYGFTLDTNNAMNYKPVPRIYGKVKVAPAYGARPYIEAVGNSQYMYLLFDFGYAPLQIDDIRIGENSILNFEGLTYYVHQNFKKGDTLNLYNNDVFQESLSLKLLDSDWRNAVTQKGSAKAVIDFQFPQGLVHTNSTNGNQENISVDIKVQYRQVGATDWLPFTATTYSIAGEGNTVINSDTMRITQATSRPFFETLTLSFPVEGEYEFQAMRLSVDSMDRYTSDDVYMASVRSIRNAPPIAPEVPHTILEMKILANDQLNGAVNNLTAVATSILPTWDGKEWKSLPTRNPSWIYLDILTGSATLRPAPMSRVDLDGIFEWAKWNDSPALNAPDQPRNRCDIIIGGEQTSWQALSLVSSTGEATPSLKSGKYSVAVDRPKEFPVQLFTPRNSSDFTSSKSYHIQPDGLRVQYIDPEQSWQSREIIVYDDGKNESNAKNFESLQLNGVTSYAQAFRIGRHTLAQGRLRSENFSIKVGVENLLATRGDLVRLSYDIPKIGTGWARVKKVDGNTITLDAPFSVVSVGNVLIARTPEAQYTMNILEVLSDDTVVVSGSYLAVNEGDLVVYGEVERATMDCLVKSISPSADLNATINLVPYGVEIYESEIKPIPDYDPIITDLDKIRPAPVVSLQATEIDSVVNRYHYLSIALSWLPPTGMYVDSYAIYELKGKNWVLLNTVHKTNTFFAYKDVRLVNDDGSTIALIGKNLTFAVVAVNSFVGSRLQPNEATKVTIKPVGDKSRPSKPLNFDLDMRTNQSITLSWRHPANNDIDHYVIRYSPLFKNANIGDSTIVVQKVAYPTTMVTVPARLGTYFIKTIDTTNNASVDFSECITPTAILNNDEFVDELEESFKDGGLVGLTMDGDSLVLPESKSIGYYYFQKKLILPAIYPVHLTSEISAVGSSSTGLAIDDHLWDARLEFRTSTKYIFIAEWGTLETVVPSLDAMSGDTGDWRPFLSGDYTVKIAQFRMVIEASPFIAVKVNKAKAIITAQERVAGRYDQIAPTTGLEVLYDPAFQIEPTIGITSDNYQTGDSYQVTNRTKEGFLIQFKNGSTPVERQFDWIAKGYGQQVSSIPQGNK